MDVKVIDGQVVGTLSKRELDAITRAMVVLDTIAAIDERAKAVQDQLLDVADNPITKHAAEFPQCEDTGATES